MQGVIFRENFHVQREFSQKTVKAVG